MAATKSFDPSLIDCVFAGIPMEGLAEDTFLEIVFEANLFTDKVGVDGEVTRNKKFDRRATATVTLMGSSLTNDALSALAKADADSPNGAGVGSFEIFDRSGTTVFRASKAWIQKVPDTSFGAEVGSRAWEIRLADCQFLVGGSVDL